MLYRIEEVSGKTGIGISIYWNLLILTMVLAVIYKNSRGKLIVSVSLLHLLVGALRSIDIHGDLRQYAFEFAGFQTGSWREVWQGGRNTLFYAFNKLIGMLTAGNFQVFLAIIAAMSAGGLGYLIERYSPQPFVSLMLWDCLGYYLFSLYSVKQTMAMVMILIAGKCLLEEEKKQFLIWTVLAGMVHFPAFIFLPAGILTDIHRASSLAGAYVSVLAVVWLFRDGIVQEMGKLYYEGERFDGQIRSAPGGRYVMMVGLLVAGMVLCGLSDSLFRKLFILMGIASLLQLFSGYDHVFTRLADYYFQFSVLYIPCLLTQTHEKGHPPWIYLDDSGQKALTVACIVMALILYQKSYLSSSSEYAAAGLLAYKWMWES